jgi:phosphomannomutase
MSRETRTKVSSSETAYLGISGVDITSAMSSSYGYPQGVLIRSVENNSAAAQAGLGAYDIIVSFDDQSVNSMSSLKSIMEYYAAGEKVTVQYYHQEGSEYVLKSVEVTPGEKKSTGLPSSNVLYYALSDNAWCCARPSGTEPKIKFYMGVKGSNLADADAKLEELTKAVMEVAGQ